MDLRAMTKLCINRWTRLTNSTASEARNTKVLIANRTNMFLVVDACFLVFDLMLVSVTFQ